MNGSGDAASRNCLNCGTPLTGPYCSQCGQRTGERLVSLRRLIADAVEDQFSLNSALPRTFGTLVFLPGRLTTDYLRGRIARYLPPFRIYLICSFLFFLTFQLTGGESNSNFVQINTGNDEEARAVADSVLAQLPDNVTAGIPPGVLPADSTRTAPDSAVATDSAEIRQAVERAYDRFPILPDWTRERLIQRVTYLSTQDNEAAGRIIRRELLARAPIAVFFLVPAYALLLAIGYLRQRRFYVEHFIFALHVHSFAFLMFTGIRLFNQQWPGLVLIGWLFLYVLLAMRHVYRQGWVKTVLKYLIIGNIYFVLLAAGVTLLGLIALLVAPI